MTPYQTNILIKEFNAHPFLGKEKQHELARSLNVSAKRIGAWYAHRRFQKKEKGLPIKGEFL